VLHDDRITCGSLCNESGRDFSLSFEAKLANTLTRLASTRSITCGLL
jgi:hypothetical protein